MYRGKKIIVLIPAAGYGRRMGESVNKQLIEIYQKPVIFYSINQFQKNSMVDEIILIVKKEEIAYFENEVKEKFHFDKITKVIEGGLERQESVYKGLLAIEDFKSIVLIHDGARPFITSKIIKDNIVVTSLHGSAVTAVRAKDTVKLVSDGCAIDTPDRSKLYLAQTPQSFHYDIIRQAHEKANKDKFCGTDDSSLVERNGIGVQIIEGDYRNIKITTPEDIKIAKAIWREDEIDGI